MKKFVFLIALLSAGGISMMADIVTLRCGEKVQTVDKSSFPNENEWNEFLEELARAYCDNDSESEDPGSNPSPEP